MSRHVVLLLALTIALIYCVGCQLDEQGIRKVVMEKQSYNYSGALPPITIEVRSDPEGAEVFAESVTLLHGDVWKLRCNPSETERVYRLVGVTPVQFDGFSGQRVFIHKNGYEVAWANAWADAPMVSEKLKDVSTDVNVVDIWSYGTFRDYKVDFGEPETRRKAFFLSFPDVPDNIRTDIEEGNVRMGMARREVLASWGAPVSMQRTIDSGGVKQDEWIYDGPGTGKQNKHLYFEDNKLMSVVKIPDLEIVSVASFVSGDGVKIVGQVRNNSRIKTYANVVVSVEFSGERWDVERSPFVYQGVMRPFDKVSFNLRGGAEALRKKFTLNVDGEPRVPARP